MKKEEGFCCEAAFFLWAWARAAAEAKLAWAQSAPIHVQETRTVSWQFHEEK